MSDEATRVNGNGKTPRRERAQRPRITAEQIEELRRRRVEGLERAAKESAPITSVLPRKQAVRLGGKPYKVGQLRIGDVALLQGIIELETPNPMDSLPLEGDPARPAAMEAAWEAIRQWPPKLGTEEGEAWLLSDVGIVAFVWVCLSRSRPKLTRDEAEAIAQGMTRQEYRILRRVAWGTPLWKEAATELGKLDGEASGPPIDWAEAFRDLADWFGWTPDQVAKLTTSQWRAYRTGKADVYRSRRMAPTRPGERSRTASGPAVGPRKTGPDESSAGAPPAGPGSSPPPSTPSASDGAALDVP